MSHLCEEDGRRSEDVGALLLFVHLEPTVLSDIDERCESVICRTRPGGDVESRHWSYQLRPL